MFFITLQETGNQEPSNPEPEPGGTTPKLPTESLESFDKGVKIKSPI